MVKLLNSNQLQSNNQSAASSIYCSSNRPPTSRRQKRKRACEGEHGEREQADNIWGMKMELYLVPGEIRLVFKYEEVLEVKR